MTKTRSGFKSDAADKIWNEHLGNNAFVKHRDQCAACLEAYRTRQPDQLPSWCPEGERIFDTTLDAVITEIDEANRNQN